MYLVKSGGRRPSLLQGRGGRHKVQHIVDRTGGGEGVGRGEDGTPLHHEVAQAQGQGFDAQLGGGVFHDRLQHGVAVHHAGGPDRRVAVDVGADAIGREAQRRHVVAALAEDDGEGAVHAVEVPAAVRVKVALHRQDFPLAVEADLTKKIN